MPPIYQYKVMECYWPALFMNVSAAIANVWARGTGLGASGYQKKYFLPRLATMRYRDEPS